MSLTLVTTSGDPRALGRAHGEQAADAIARSVALYEGIAAERDSWSGLLSKVGPYVDAARSGLPHLAEEVEGLAEGAGIESDALWMLNCMEEVWPFEACTSAVSGRFLMHAEQWYAGHDSIALVTAQPARGPAFVSPTCAGFLPVVGMSAAGFAQGIDSLTADDDRVGVPRLLVSRHGLDADNLDGAILSAQVPGRAGGYAHVFATASRRAIVETTATRSVVLEDDGLHTNHALAPAIKTVAPGASDGSRARLERARELVENDPPTTVEDCMSILRDHDSEPQAICEHKSDEPTASSTVFGMVCDLVAGTVYVSDGHPCEGRWTETAVPGFATTGAAHVG